MKKIAISLVFTFLAFSTYAQIADWKGNIKGVIIDSLNNQKIAFATISIKLENNTSIRSALSKEDGSFVIEKLPAGKHTLSVLNVGYKKY